jgi:CheY-like chemotaxis protein
VGLEALAILQSGQRIDLVLLDVVMPRLGGPQTLARIRERWPEIKVVLSSGYRDGARIGSVLPGTVVLEKPYRGEELLRRVHEELAGSGK